MARATIRPSDRFRIFQRDGFCCRYCGKAPGETELQLDHLIPVAKGGDDSYLNLITSCRLCNAGKGQNDAQRVPIPVEVIERTKDYANRLVSMTAESKRLLKAELAESDLVCDFINKVLYIGKSEITPTDIACVRTLRGEFGDEPVLAWMRAAVAKDVDMRSFCRWMYGCAKRERGE